ncbi:MAG: hypothetical protein Q9199_006367 [Rusavskia elegans]
MDIDLDAFFGGQCATDLDDYDEADATTAQPTPTIDLDAFFDGQSATDLDDDDDDDDDTTTVEVDITAGESTHTNGYYIYTHANKVFMRDGLDGDSIINAPGYRPPKHSQLKRDDAGKLVTWDGIKVARPVYRPSPLRQVESTAECIEASMTPIDTTTDDCASSSCSSSDTDTDAETPPSSPEAASTPITRPCPPLSLLSPVINTTPIDSATKPSADRSQYAGMYAAFIIGLSVVICLW